jgi:uncharacterized membrane protein YphA (DoxX/SURF4 family)
MMYRRTTTAAGDELRLGRSSEIPDGSSHSGLFLADVPPHAPSPQPDPTAAAFVWLGRLFIGVSLLAFGVQHFLYSGFIGDLGLVPDWAPAHLFWAWLAGAILLLAGLSVLTGIYARLATTLLGCVFLLSAFLRFTTHIPGMLHNIGDRGVFFELLACCAGSWMLARSFSPPGSGSGPGFLPVSDALTARLATPARWLFGIALVVFGSLHLQAPGWIAGLIPHWIPFHLFFALFTGSALVAAGLAIAAQVWTRLSAALLALMLFSWVLIVHAPRIAHALHNGDEWNSGYVCLTMAGFALITAALADRKPSDVH